MLRILPPLLVIALWIWAFIDCVTTPEQEVRHLPKVIWVIIVLLFPLVGSVAWLVAGRRRGSVGATAAPAAARRVDQVAPDDNPEFLASLGQELGQANRAREAQLKRWEADLRRREEELRGKDDQDGGPC
ncbi:PLD nuclease N-terminal domain-containing protein [Kitasatospora sp. MAP5-34]|uniref:PLD nuclease N-terminal domain-containing protein n=1 Tax=Kitasatospora sp. MAP5-34 TaxID=3035102 RepID=UPI0024733D2A|nr:PLD nuclease N-terminal domain-containing protein [Kitasatospora sp. MAP5-34]MDH6578335.1 hypothetical protein [Kitasatospora sp. MAP5-34]